MEAGRVTPCKQERQEQCTVNEQYSGHLLAVALMTDVDVPVTCRSVM